jgi:hypothetical protein
MTGSTGTRSDWRLANEAIEMPRATSVEREAGEEEVRDMAAFQNERVRSRVVEARIGGRLHLEPASG